MTVLRLEDLRQHADVLRSQRGEVITVRFVEPRDADSIQNYFRGLSARSRYNRFFGAISQLPPGQLDRVLHVGEADQFRRRLDLMAVQRNLKALGTFGYQGTTRGNPVYIQYIPRTLRYLRTNLERYPRFSRLRSLLAAHVDELR